MSEWNNLITETTEETVTEVSKSQTIRIIDVAVIGPTMMYAGAVKSGLPKVVRVALFVFGACTIYYNAKNYLSNVRHNQNRNSAKN